MSILATVYASAPTDNMILGALEIQIQGRTPIRYTTDFAGHWLGGVDGGLAYFESGPLTVSLPARNASGNQRLNFGVSGVSGMVQDLVMEALASETPVIAIYREYLLSDKSAPARRPYIMQVNGGYFENPMVVFECSYYDLLNSRWPRENYTNVSAPGVQFL